jgi:glyoxylase-like metal-dependent hydrolase (beta-lactamase superfamily II)
MKIVEFGDDGKPVERDRIKVVEFGVAELPKSAKSGAAPDHRRKPSDIQLYMFQTGTLRTKLKYIKMNQGEQNFEIPVPWFLIKHPLGNVVIDGGNAVEAAIDPRGHWGDVVDAYDPVMDVSENCVDQLRGVGVRPEDVRYVLQSHLHLDHTGALGRFPRATYFVQRIEHEYAYDPDWFAKAAYIREDFDRPGLNWKFLGGEYTDHYDLFGDGAVRMIFTPGHSPGHQSFLIRLPNAGPVLLTIDAAYTMDHWEERALPGLVCSSVDAAKSVRKLRKIAAETGAMVVAGHDPDLWRSLRHAPASFYD